MPGIPDEKLLKAGDFRAIARALTLIENDLSGARELLLTLRPASDCRVIGVTGAPGTGKSTLVSGLVTELSRGESRIAVLAIDPTSPFNYGSLLGDRIRMSAHFNRPDVFIRSLATRGSLGGLSAKTIEMTDVLRASGFRYIIVETVGVGQSEVEIAGLADLTFVVLVPEAGDEIQHIKSGIMEIADGFVINKSDREGAGAFAGHLRKILEEKGGGVPVLETVATTRAGIGEWAQFIAGYSGTNDRKNALLAEKAYRLIQDQRMSGVSRSDLQAKIERATKHPDFNLYRFVEEQAANRT